MSPSPALVAAPARDVKDSLKVDGDMHPACSEGGPIETEQEAPTESSRKRLRHQAAPLLRRTRTKVLTGTRASSIRNPIREIMDNIAGKENPDKAIIPLAQGDPTAYPHLRPSESMISAVVQALTSGTANGYQPSQGMSACRAAVAEAFSVPNRPALAAGDVFMTLGCSEALSHCIAALAGEGGNMLLPRPGFPLYEVLCQYHGVEIRYYDLLPDQDWQIDVAGLEALVDERTCAMLVNSPSNPCGAVYSREHLEEVMREAEALHLPIIADEVYAGMSFREPFVACAAVSAKVPVLSVCALSKRWLAPGWRVGWLTVHDADDALKEAAVPETLLKLCQVSLGPSAPLQAAVPSILRDTPASWYEAVLGALERSARCCVERAARVPGLSIASAPQGSMYLMVGLEQGALQGVGADDVAFARCLLQEESVTVLPGQCFRAPGFFRVVFAAPPEVLEQAWDRIEAFCRRRYVGAAPSSA